MAYKLETDIRTNKNEIRRLHDGASIPSVPANTDYAEFKKAVTAGAELQDADGNTMTSQDVQAFIATLP